MRSFKQIILAAVLVLALMLPAALPHGTADAQGCGTAPAPRLTIGQAARVTITNGTGNNLRATAATTATVLGVLPDGEIVGVLSGPQCVENLYWWQVRRWDGQTGWTAEGDATGYWMELWPVVGGQIAAGARPALPDLPIAFLAGYEGYLVPHTIAADGSGLQTLGQTPAVQNRLTWSPDGLRLVFSDGNNVWDIGQLDAVQVTSTPDSAETWPTVSPDGQRIAYVRESATGSDILITSLADLSTVALTDDPAQDTMPAWSPDGSRIAFISTRDGGAELYVIGVDGSGLARLTSTAGEESTPVWSSDGQRIAYTVTEQGVRRLAVVTPGMQPVLLSEAQVDGAPAWSPDSQRIVYAAETPTGSGQYEVFSVRADGQDRFQYTVSGGQVAGVTWSPGGEWIVFADNTAGSYDLYAIRPNGIGLARLTDNPGIDAYPVFPPPTAPNLPDEGGSAAPDEVAESAPGEEDLLLLYNTAVPVFTLKNTSGQSVNIAPLTFVGGGISVPTSIWGEYTASPLDNFKALGCLMLWPFGIEEQAPPLECGDARQGWVSNSNYIFWTQGSFEVRYGDALLATCQTAAERCTVDLP